MENNEQNNENSQNQEQKPQRDRRPNPHRQNNSTPNPNRRPQEGTTQSGNTNNQNQQREDRPNPNPSRKPHPNRKPNPNRNQNDGQPSEGQSNKQNRNANRNRKPNPNQKPGNKPNNPNQNRSGGGGKGRGKRKNITTVNDTMRASIEENARVKDATMNPWKQIDMASKGKIRFTPLGGLGEIGGNMAVLETETTAIVIDVGMSFPDETMHGVDILVPDFSYLHTIKDKIKAIIITHGHEDHIGAMPYLFKELKFPIYATPLALAMIENKFNERMVA